MQGTQLAFVIEKL